MILRTFNKPLAQRCQNGLLTVTQVGATKSGALELIVTDSSNGLKMKILFTKPSVSNENFSLNGATVVDALFYEYVKIYSTRYFKGHTLHLKLGNEDCIIYGGV